MPYPPVRPGRSRRRDVGYQRHQRDAWAPPTCPQASAFPGPTPRDHTRWPLTVQCSRITTLPTRAIQHAELSHSAPGFINKHPSYYGLSDPRQWCTLVSVAREGVAMRNPWWAAVDDVTKHVFVYSTAFFFRGRGRVWIGNRRACIASDCFEVCLPCVGCIGVRYRRR